MQVPQLLHLHFVAAPPSRQSARPHHRFAGFEEDIVAKRFKFRLVQRLHDDVRIREKRFHAFRIQPTIVNINLQRIVDPQDIRLKRLHLLLAHLVAEEELAVQIRLAHRIKVANEQLLHPGPRQVHGHVAPQSPGAQYPHLCALQFCALAGGKVRVHVSHGR